MVKDDRGPSFGDLLGPALGDSGVDSTLDARVQPQRTASQSWLYRCATSGSAGTLLGASGIAWAAGGLVYVGLETLVTSYSRQRFSPSKSLLPYLGGAALGAGVAAGAHALLGEDAAQAAITATQIVAGAALAFSVIKGVYNAVSRLREGNYTAGSR